MGASYSSFQHTYDVFLSFRCEDTGRNFTDHLYKALIRSSIHTFRESDTIRRGENIELEIEKAIRGSIASIVVFSKDYASSRYCLNELVMIMELKRTAGQTVLPIFYDVDPAQVRNQTDSYGDAFAKHEKKLQDLDGVRQMEEKERVEKWRAALKEAADVKGLVLDDRLETQFIRNVVEQIEIPAMSSISCRRYWNRFLLLSRSLLLVVLVSLNMVGYYVAIRNINDSVNEPVIQMLFVISRKDEKNAEVEERKNNI